MWVYMYVHDFTLPGSFVFDLPLAKVTSRASLMAIILYSLTVASNGLKQQAKEAHPNSFYGLVFPLLCVCVCVCDGLWFDCQQLAKSNGPQGHR